MTTIQDLSLEIQQMIVQHAMYMPTYILYTTPSDVQQVYRIYLQLKIVDDQVILHCIKELHRGKQLEYFKETNTEEPFAVTSVPKKEGLCECEDGDYRIENGVATDCLWKYDSEQDALPPYSYDYYY